MATYLQNTHTHLVANISSISNMQIEYDLYLLGLKHKTLDLEDGNDTKVGNIH